MNNYFTDKLPSLMQVMAFQIMATTESSLITITDAITDKLQAKKRGITLYGSPSYTLDNKHYKRFMILNNAIDKDWQSIKKAIRSVYGDHCYFVFYPNKP